MNIDNFYDGQKVIGYAEMCTLAEEKKKTGKSKQLQEKNWSRYMLYKHEKNKKEYNIIKVYETPVPKIDKRKDNRHIVDETLDYASNLEILILDLLSKVDDIKEEGILLSKSRLLNGLSMINDNYMKIKNAKIQLVDILNVEYKIIDDFYNSTDRMLVNSIESALDSLTDQKLIIWNREIIIIKQLDDVGVITDGGIASSREKMGILEVENEVLLKFAKEYSINTDKADWRKKTNSAIYAEGENKRYAKEVDEILLERYSIKYHYTSYHIIFNLDTVKEADNLYKLSDDNRKKEKGIVNKKVQNKISNNASGRQKKAKKKKEKKTSHRSRLRYVKDIEKISKKLIDSDAKTIKL